MNAAGHRADPQLEGWVGGPGGLWADTSSTPPSRFRQDPAAPRCLRNTTSRGKGSSGSVSVPGHLAVASGPVEEQQNMMVGQTGKAKLLTSCQPGHRDKRNLRDTPPHPPGPLPTMAPPGDPASTHRSLGHIPDPNHSTCYQTRQVTEFRTSFYGLGEKKE